jgi:hypothetical protein
MTSTTLTRHHVRAIAVLALALVLALGILIEPASAATNIGKNVGEELKGFVGPVLLVLAAVCMLPLLAKRNASVVLVVAVMAMVIGMFVFAQGSVKEIITEVAASIAGR